VPVSGSVASGLALVGGLLIFTVGAVAWRLAFQAPLPQALPAVHAERRRHTWIHTWMVVAMFVTPAGVVGFAATTGSVLAAMAAAVYLIGATCWLVSLTFRLTVMQWAAGEAVATGSVPGQVAALDSWAGSLYVLHMTAAYAAFAGLGAAVLTDGGPAWLGWLGVGLGLACLGGFVATRFAGPFNPPILAHTYSGVLGVWLLTAA
jgi:hypothetical protein